MHFPENQRKGGEGTGSPADRQQIIPPSAQVMLFICPDIGLGGSDRPLRHPANDGQAAALQDEQHPDGAGQDNSSMDIAEQHSGLLLMVPKMEKEEEDYMSDVRN